MNTDRRLPEIFKKIPLLFKILLAAGPIAIAAAYIFYSTSENIKNKRKFYSESFSSVITKSNTSEGRTTEFYLENGLKIYFWLSAKNTVMINDSIHKDANSYLYNVYRKDFGGKYQFYETYDFLKME